MATQTIWGNVGNEAFALPMVKLTPAIPATQNYLLAWSVADQALDYVNPKTGWATPTGTATRSTFDTATVTTTQLAERLKGLIDDLTALKLLGA